MSYDGEGHESGCRCKTCVPVPQVSDEQAVETIARAIDPSPMVWGESPYVLPEMRELLPQRREAALAAARRVDEALRGLGYRNRSEIDAELGRLHGLIHPNAEPSLVLREVRRVLVGDEQATP